MSFKANTTLGPGMANQHSMFPQRANKVNTSNNFSWDSLDEENPELGKEEDHANKDGGVLNMLGIETFNGYRIMTNPNY